MWSRITSPRPRQRAGGGSGTIGGGRRNSTTSNHASRPGSLKARDYDRSSPATGSRSASIRDHRRRQATLGYCDSDDVEWGENCGEGGGGVLAEWEDNAREAIKVATTAQVTIVDGDDEEGEAEEENNNEEEVVASLDSLSSSHQSSIMGDYRAANRVTIVGGEGPPPFQSAPMTTSSGGGAAASAANTSFPRLIPARYRIRDFLLGDFSFNDDGERYVNYLPCFLLWRGCT